MKRTEPSLYRSSSTEDLYKYYVQQYRQREQLIWKRYRAEMHVEMLDKEGFEFQLAKYEDVDRARRWSVKQSIKTLVRKATSSVSKESAITLKGAIMDQIAAEQERAARENREFDPSNVLGGYTKEPTIFELQNRKWTWDEIKNNYHALKEYAQRNESMLKETGIMKEGESASHYAAQQIHDAYFYYS